MPISSHHFFFRLRVHPGLSDSDDHLGACHCSVYVIDLRRTHWCVLSPTRFSGLCAICIFKGMIKATTNREVGLNVITELVVGYMLPHKPIAMMM
jgi:hypothetical protein